VNTITSTKRQLGKLDGPFQIFSVIEKDVDDAGLVTESEHFVVFLENFGFISGFVVESFARAEALAFNVQFFEKIRENKDQKRLNVIYDALPEPLRERLKSAMDTATKKFNEVVDPTIRRRRDHRPR